MSSPFPNWTVADVAAYNARQGVEQGKWHGEGVEREADLHDAIITECKRRGWNYVHARMDRATTTALGVPDFIIAADGGRTYWLEVKSKDGKLTSEQNATIHWLRSLGHRAEIVRNISQFISVIDTK